MSNAVIINEQPLRLCPHGDLGIYQVRALKQSLLDAISRYPAIEIDLDEVGRVDAACMQVFALIHREAAATGKRFLIRGGNPDWSRLVSVLGMDSYFGDCLTLPAFNNPDVEHEPGSASANLL